MGWTSYGNLDKKEFIHILMNEKKDDPNYELIDYSVKGNHIWEVFKHEGKKYLGIELLQKNQGEWMHKGMPVSAGPYYYDCPLKYLDMVPESDSEYERRWREEVRGYHKKKKEQKEWKKIFSNSKRGDIFRVVFDGKDGYLVCRSVPNHRHKNQPLGTWMTEETIKKYPKKNIIAEFKAWIEKEPYKRSNINRFPISRFDSVESISFTTLKKEIEDI